MFGSFPRLSHAWKRLMDDINVFGFRRDDFMAIVAPYFREIGLDLERSNSSDVLSNYLDCTVWIAPDLRVHSRHFNKRDLFAFPVNALPDFDNPYPHSLFLHVVIARFLAIHHRSTRRDDLVAALVRYAKHYVVASSYPVALILRAHDRLWRQIPAGAALLGFFARARTRRSLRDLLNAAARA
ncbi:hypothetical protein DFJ74DRAFT_742733 [Hyaloraphidium curvatum]|nr:hypothetical protein DFJ74DRAFT_742733 [Hyaloraphidium curvatum]